MKKAPLAILGCLAALSGWTQTLPLTPYVREVDYMVQAFADGGCTEERRSLLVLYVGNSQTEETDRLTERAGVSRSISLVHPTWTADVGAASSRTAAGSGRPAWYMTEVDSVRNVVRRGPLLVREVWQTLPVLAQQAFLALGRDEQELILIAWSRSSGSLSIYFSPSVQSDRAFYDRKLRALRAYLDEHGSETEVPFERADPAGPVGTFTSS